MPTPFFLHKSNQVIQYNPWEMYAARHSMAVRNRQ